MGLGVSGQSVLRFLLDRGARVFVSEKRAEKDIPPDLLSVLQGVIVETGGHSKAFVEQADMIVVSPGVPLDLPILQDAVAKGIPLIGELALFAGEFRKPVIAVTGSNGKTTVTALLGVILQQAGFRPFVGGNIGTPLLQVLFELEHYDMAVLELSSFQLAISGNFRPDIALLLNLSPDHLDRHGDMESYLSAKSRIFVNQMPGDVAIIGTDCSFLGKRSIEPPGWKLSFGSDSQCAARVVDKGVEVAFAGGKELFDLTETSLADYVGRLNAAAAIQASMSAGADVAGIKRGLAAFSPARHRQELVAEIDGVRFVNDSKATNTGALQASLLAQPGKVILLAGGQLKGADFNWLQDDISKKVKLLLPMGEAAEHIVSVFGGVLDLKKVAGIKEALQEALLVAEPGDTVLLAPGCASFDMFSGYEERGDVFVELVQGLNGSLAGKMGNEMHNQCCSAEHMSGQKCG